MNLPLLLRLAGMAHFGILSASATVPRVLNWRKELRLLDPVSRQLVWTHGAFTVLTIIGFGIITVLNATALAAGTPLARTVCGFIAVFWGARLFLQLAVLDCGPMLRTVGLKVGYHGLTVVFAYLAGTYGWAAVI